MIRPLLLALTITSCTTSPDLKDTIQASHIEVGKKYTYSICHKTDEMTPSRQIMEINSESQAAPYNDPKICSIITCDKDDKNCVHSGRQDLKDAVTSHMKETRRSRAKKNSKKSNELCDKGDTTACLHWLSDKDISTDQQKQAIGILCADKKNFFCTRGEDMMPNRQAKARGLELMYQSITKKCPGDKSPRQPCKETKVHIYKKTKQSK